MVKVLFAIFVMVTCILIGAGAAFIFVESVPPKQVSMKNFRVVRVVDADVAWAAEMRVVPETKATSVARAMKNRNGPHARTEICTPYDLGDGVFDPSDPDNCQAI